MFIEESKKIFNMVKLKLNTCINLKKILNRKKLSSFYIDNFLNYPYVMILQMNELIILN